MITGVGSLNLVREELISQDLFNPVCFSNFSLDKTIERKIHQTLVDDTIKTVGIINDSESYILTLETELNNLNSLGFAENRKIISSASSQIGTVYETIIPIGGLVIIPNDFILLETQGIYNLTIDNYLLHITDYTFTGTTNEIQFNTQYEGNAVQIGVFITNGDAKEMGNERIGSLVFTGTFNTILGNYDKDDLIIQIDDLRPIGDWSIDIDGGGVSSLVTTYQVIQGLPSIKIFRIPELNKLN